MSGHFKRSLAGISALAVVILAFLLWAKHKLDHMTFSLPPQSASGLKVGEREVVAFSELRHRVTVYTSSGTTTMYARNPVIRVRQDGRITVDRHTFGFEARPYIGFGYSDTTRAILGFQPFYFGPADASFALGISLDKQYVFARPYVALGYNCWGNLSVNAGIDPIAIRQLDVILFASIKL